MKINDHDSCFPPKMFMESTLAGQKVGVHYFKHSKQRKMKNTVRMMISGAVKVEVCREKDYKIKMLHKGFNRKPNKSLEIQTT